MSYTEFWCPVCTLLTKGFDSKASPSLNQYIHALMMMNDERGKSKKVNCEYTG